MMRASKAKAVDPAVVVETVVREVAKAYGLAERQVTGRAQTPPIFLEARTLAATLCTCYCAATRAQIAQRFGGRSACWVTDSVRAYERRYTDDLRFRITVARVTEAVEKALP